VTERGIGELKGMLLGMEKNIDLLRGDVKENNRRLSGKIDKIVEGCYQHKASVHQRIENLRYVLTEETKAREDADRAVESQIPDMDEFDFTPPAIPALATPNPLPSPIEASSPNLEVEVKANTEWKNRAIGAIAAILIIFNTGLAIYKILGN